MKAIVDTYMINEAGYEKEEWEKIKADPQKGLHWRHMTKSKERILKEEKATILVKIAQMIMKGETEAFHQSQGEKDKNSATRSAKPVAKKGRSNDPADTWTIVWGKPSSRLDCGPRGRPAGTVQKDPHARWR